MRKLTYLFIAASMIAGSVATAQTVADDLQYIQDNEWRWDWAPGANTNPADGFVQQQAVAYERTGYAPESDDFDEVWNVYETSYSIANLRGSSDGGNDDNHTGPADFTGAFKVLYDDDFGSVFVLLRYEDDDITGNETYELMWQQEEKIEAIQSLVSDGTIEDHNPYGTVTGSAALKPYMRYLAFGGYKAGFNNSEYTGSMTIDPTLTSIPTWTNTSVLTNGIVEVYDKTGTAQGVKKIVFELTYNAFSGAQRTALTKEKWTALNDGKGFSFDIKVTDNDAAGSGEYWWSSNLNAGFAITKHSGFVAPAIESSVSTQKAANSIFGTFSGNVLQLKSAADVVVYNVLGKQVLKLANVTEVDLSGLSGVFVVKAGNEVKKVAL